MPTTVTEIISALLPDATGSDMVIERFDEWHNPTDANPATTGCCTCF
ncbi:MAG TPA: hypothetical protein VH352_23535 [Pseudonocardiaceae bacterium]|nr:hypothetical protein [Pseudonocardiaceae bacterium]